MSDHLISAQFFFCLPAPKSQFVGPVLFADMEVEESSAEDLESDLLGEGSEGTRKNVESSEERKEMMEGSAVQTVVEPCGRSGSARRTPVLRSSTSTLSQYTR